LALVFTAGDTLWATPNHPFWYKDQYVEAEALSVWDTLTAADGSTEVITNTFVKDTTLKVYNFTVEDNHNYYVGTSGLLVHNDCFLDKIKHSPGLVAAIDELPPGLKGKFIEDFFEAGDDVLEVLKREPGCVRAWEKLWGSSDEGIKLLRKNTDQLEKFNDLIIKNNLGLDADGILDILNAAAKKGQKWDFPENILDAVKRASDADIQGLKVVHKKFATPSEGSDPFVLNNAKQYQQEASGDAGLSIELNGRSFDNITSDGKLIDRKYGHGSSVFNPDGTVKNQARANKIIQQATDQINDAGGRPIGWEISTELGFNGIKQIFIREGLNIEVKYVAQKIIIN